MEKYAKSQAWHGLENAETHNTVISNARAGKEQNMVLVTVEVAGNAFVTSTVNSFTEAIYHAKSLRWAPVLYS